MKRARCGNWSSPITPALAASGAVRIGGLRLDGGDVYWLEGRPADQGRNVIVRRRADGSVEDVTPAGFNVRTRVHEYGGGAFTVDGGMVFFLNDADQRLWSQAPGAAPRPLSPEGRTRFADLELDRARDRIICVQEDHTQPGEPRNSLVVVPLAGGAPQPLVAGADFYSGARLSPDGGQLAYLSWSHPRMPWQGTELWLAPVRADGTLGAAEKIAGGPTESIFQPAWSPDGVLHFVSDRSGWWNLYRAPGQPVWPVDAECGMAQWVFGMTTYGFVDRRTVAVAFQQSGAWRLALVTGGAVAHVELPLTEINYLQTAPGRAVFAGGSPAAPVALWGVSVEPGAPAVATRLHEPSAPPVEEAYLSRPTPITFGTAKGVAHGLYYAPRNPDCAPLDGERPPLIVVSHGGPTAAASSGLNLALQFWTSRGFAVLDVNYRGSTGYGRAYRDALDGAWGVADVEDCAAGARDLVARGLADGARLAIRGGSAGGYTTLAALVFTDVFRAGASYYGVSDLEALAKDTHKFESRYLDGLIGPYPARRDLYLERSPINHVARLSCPVIFFQGQEDKVVPPDQAERMVAALRDKGLPVEYVAFPGEQHGFRRAETIARALEAELAFYTRVFSLA
jgi:dipeptidyl aminopeptidase/acylaminoacyl peptidase